MTINKSVNGTELIVNVDGHLDTTTAPQLEAELKNSLPDAQSLIMNFENLDYISSAGLRVLLYAHKVMAARGGMKVININDIVREVFEVTGFSDILDIE